MNCLHKPFSIVLLSFTVFWGCESVAVFPQCNGDELEPGEECELFMNGTSDAEKPCRELGYPSGRRATCDSMNCRWNTTSCESATNNVNNVNNVNNNLECDPLDPLAECGAQEACYFDQNDTRTRCESLGIRGINEECNWINACMLGLVCLWDVCTQMCDQSGSITCAQNLNCTEPGWPNGWGFCPLVDNGCDPILGGGCPSAASPEVSDREYCYYFQDGARVWHTACLHPGTMTVGVCSEINDCVPGYVCISNDCRKVCTETSDCDGGLTCSDAQGITVCQ